LAGSLCSARSSSALIKAVSTVWLGRTESHARASFDDVLCKGDLIGALLEVYDSEGKSRALHRG